MATTWTNVIDGAATTVGATQGPPGPTGPQGPQGDPGTLTVTDGSVITATGSTTARTLADRFATQIDVRDFGAVGDGVTNDTAAFQAAINSVASGQDVRLWVPRGTYLLSGSVTENGRFVSIEYDAGATTTGTGPTVNTQVRKRARSQEIVVSGAATNFSTVGPLTRITNTSGTAGYGKRTNYISTGAVASGFDIGDGIIADFRATAGGQGLAQWLVAATPVASSANFGVFCAEVNVINRSADMGYVKRRSLLSRWTGGIQMVPEANDVVGGGGLIGNHVTYGLAVTHSAAANTTTGDYAKSYNAVLVERDAVAPGGRGVLLSGDSTGDAPKLPNYAIEIDERWAAGIHTVSATFTGNRVATFGTAQTLGWSNPTYAGTTSAEIAAEADGTHNGTSTPGRLAFRTTASSATAATERACLTKDGRFGIGTASPTVPLDITSGTAQVLVKGAVAGLVIDRDASQAFITYRIAGTQVGDIRADANGLQFRHGSSGTEWLRISSTGALVHRANATTIVDAESNHQLRSYTVATLPSASPAARMIYVSDGASNKRLAISDGTNWRWPDGAVVS